MTSAADVLRAAFARHTWATLGLIDALEGIDPARLDDAVPGTYGTIAETLTHLVGSDDRYLQRLELDTLPPYDDGGPWSLAELRTRAQEQSAQWSTMLDRLEAGTLHARIVDKPDYPDTDHAEGLLFGQALHHGDDHRAQINSTLGALGLDVPDLDVWAYWASERNG
jgi:uncharacterized damage-inducible protein DinB